MRLKLNLHQSQSNQFIPFNYQYPISRFINYTLIKYGANYFNWLVKNGFDQHKNHLDYFTFSYLKIPKFESESDSLKVISADVNLNLGMLSDEPYENTILNIFRNKRLKIDSDGHSAEFRIVDIKKEESPDLSGIVRFKTISPLVITQKVVFNGYESNYYMKPEDADYAEHFKNVLIMKYKNYIKNSGKFKLAQKSSGSIPIQHFKIKGPVKSRLISIERKGVTVNKIRGFQYAFEISGDKDLLKFAYETGFGNYGGWGMGCVAKEENHSPDFNSVKEFPLEYNKSYDSLYK